MRVAELSLMKMRIMIITKGRTYAKALKHSQPDFTRATGNMSDPQKDVQWEQGWQYLFGLSPYSCVRASSCVSRRKSHFFIPLWNDTSFSYRASALGFSAQTHQWIGQPRKIAGKQWQARQNQLHPTFKRGWSWALRSCVDVLSPLKQSYGRVTESSPWTWPCSTS